MMNMGTNQKRLNEIIVTSFPIYELQQVRIEGHRYPRRRINRQRLGFHRLEEDSDECEHPSHFFDESDDCYLVYTLGEVGSHFHPVCYNVFRPTHPVPEKVVAQLRANLEENQPR